MSQNNHPDENDARIFARCDCCGRHHAVPSYDEDHASWCANRGDYSDEMVEAMAREQGDTTDMVPPRGYADTTALTEWRLALMMGGVR